MAPSITFDLMLVN